MTHRDSNAPSVTVPAPEQVERADDGDRTGSKIARGRYTLLRHLGSGGMAEVYVAEHNGIGKRLVIKILSPRFASDPIHVERFVREARAASAIAHDNVIDVTDFGTTPDGSAFMAMELLDGEPLSTTLRRDAPLPWKRAKTISLQICRALHAAHGKGVVHRDMKPDNCMRLRRGANRDFIKVLDFGIAKIVGNELRPVESITKTGSVFGTPAYMAPEQARGQKCDHRADIYAVGVMLYEMITGERLFTGQTPLMIMTKHATEAPTPPRLRAPQAEISAELEAVVLRALAKEPAERFDTMREMAEAIAAIPVRSETQNPAASSSIAEPPSPPPVSYRSLALILGVLSVVLLATLVAVLVGGT